MVLLGVPTGVPRKTLKERIPEIEKVVDIQPEQEPLTAAGVEEVRVEWRALR